MAGKYLSSLHRLPIRMKPELKPTYLPIYLLGSYCSEGVGVDEGGGMTLVLNMLLAGRGYCICICKAGYV
jgi:hypothetical protein